MCEYMYVLQQRYIYVCVRVCECVWVCVCVCVCVCESVCMLLFKRYTSICVCVCEYVSVFECVCLFVCLYDCVCNCVCLIVCMFECVWVCVWACVRAATLLSGAPRLSLEVRFMKTTERQNSRVQLKCDGTRAKIRFSLSAKRRVHLNRRGTSVQSTTGIWVVSISGSNAEYTMFRGSVKGTGYPLHSPVSLSLPSRASPCSITFQLQSNTTYVCMYADCYHSTNRNGFIKKIHIPVTMSAQNTEIPSFVWNHQAACFFRHSPSCYFREFPKLSDVTRCLETHFCLCWKNTFRDALTDSTVPTNR